METSSEAPTTPISDGPTDGRGTAEFTIDELAREASTTVRNVRAYQERGLIPPPQRRGRNGVYTESHLARLRVIARMLERGYSLANVSELIAAWEHGHDIGQLLGLEAALTSPWSDEAATMVPMERLLEIFGGDLPPAAIAKCLELGLVQVVGDQLQVPSMKMLNVGAALAKEGIPMERLLGIVGGLRSNVERVADELVQLIAHYVFDRFGKDRLPPPEEAPHLAELVWRLRPMAMQAVDSEMARAMELAVNRLLGDRLSQILQQMQVQASPGETSAGP